MKRVKAIAVRKVVRRIAPMACVAILSVGAAGCGSSSKTGNNNAPTPTSSPSGATTAPGTTDPQSGGAGF